MAAVMGGHVAAVQPIPLADEIPDPVSYEEASALLARTGHPAAPSTLRRWVKEDRLSTVRSGRTVLVSWSELLEAHRRRTAVKLRAGSDWP